MSNAPFSGHAMRFMFFPILATLIFYSTWNTGLATDDFVFLSQALNSSLKSNLLPNIYISVPLLHYTHALAYFAFGEHLWAYDLLKATYLLFVLYTTARFFGKFHSPSRARLGALVLLLSPIHDGATLWLTGQYLILSLGLYFLAYVKADEGRDFQAFLLAMLGSFCSYGSPPLAAGLALMFMLNRRWRAAALMLLPNFIYSTYYIYTSVAMRSGTPRLPGELQMGTVVKSYAVQLGSFADAGVGPSAWLKFALSISSLGWISALVALATALWLWRAHGLRVPDAGLERGGPLLVGAAAISLAAFGIFSLTASYPQVAFNLGDRITIYGNLFVAAALMRLAPQPALAGAAIITITAFLGIGDHWARWNQITQASAARIRVLDTTKLVSPDEIVFVKGLQYSRLGPMTHIDHFTADYVVRDVFTFARQSKLPIHTASFNRRLQIKDGALVDVKYGHKHALGQSIMLYDADAGSLGRIPASDIGALLAKLPPELRHWTQLFGPGRIRDLILWLMPSLQYAYPP